MRLSFDDAAGAAVDAARGFRWGEYGPFFAILLIELVFLWLTTQLGSGWAMGVVAPIVRWTGGEEHLHYPGLLTYLPIVMGWVESGLYVVPGCVLIPLALLRILSRSDRVLSLGAGAGSRLAGAVLPTLVAILLGIGANWGWQRTVAPQAGKLVLRYLPGEPGVFVAWLVTLLGGYAILALLLYVPVAAVQARATFPVAIGHGVRFGILALLPTLTFAFILAAPANAVQYLLARQSAMFITKLQPESIIALLAVYAALSSWATYVTYGTAIRFYRTARGGE